MSELTDIWHDRRVNIGYETAEELAKHYNLLNWRGHPESQRDATEESLDALGYVGAIKKSVQSGVILDGHLRIEIALAKDPSIKLPVDYYDLSPDEEALALQVLDATTEMAEPIADKLADLLERTREMTADRPGLGAMLERLKERAGINGDGQGDNGNEPPMPTETEAERLAKEYETAPGQVWQLGRHIIACCDSTDEAAVRELIGGKAVGMVWADPPYGMELDTKYSERPLTPKAREKHPVQRDYAPVLGDNQDFDPTAFFDMFKGVREQLWWGADYYCQHLPQGGSWLVWDKRTSVEEVEYSSSSFELCWSLTPHRRDIFRIPWFGLIGTEQEPDKKRFHPTQKPVNLALGVFTKYGQPNDLILDPFLGSGTSILASEKLNDGRRVIGCELAHEYIAVVLFRWQQMTGQTPRRVSG